MFFRLPIFLRPLCCKVTLVTSLLLICGSQPTQGTPVGGGQASQAKGGLLLQGLQGAQGAQGAAGQPRAAGKVIRLYDETTPFRKYVHEEVEIPAGEFDVEKELSDPSKEWARVRNDPDFLLLNDDEQALQQFPSRRHPKLQQDLLEDLLLGEDEQQQLSRHNFEKRAGNSVWGKRAKQLRLSLTDNIDVLRERLFMEIARRNRLLNENQVSMANTGLANIG